MLKIRLYLLAIVFVTGGCCAHQFDRPAAVIDQGPKLLQKLRGATARIQSFEYVTRIEYYSDDDVKKGEVELLGKRPDQLRFEALTPTGDTLAVLVSDGKQFISHERGNSTCYVGESCAANVSRLLPLAMEGHQFVEVLSGGAPIIDHSVAQSRWDECAGAYRLTLRRQGDDLVQRVWMRPDTFHPVKVEVDDGSKRLITLTYSEHFEHKGVWVPARITFKSPHRSVDLSLQVRERWHNSITEPKVFAPVCPPGTVERVLQCR